MLKNLVYAITANRTLTDFISRKGMTTGFAKRFVAGEDLPDAISAARQFNHRRMQCSLNLLGEHVSEHKKADEVTHSYLQTLEAIHQSGVDGNLSVKLTQLGLDFDRDFCRQNLETVIARARDLGNFVRIDMESSSYTQQTLDLHREMRVRFDNVGTVIQSCLYRSEQDVRELNALKSRVRLCKGAYLEPPAVAFPRKADVDDNFVKLTEILLRDGIFPALATHDEKMIQHTKRLAKKHGIPREGFEFQMILGVRRDLQETLRREGYNIRVYIPFGRDWLAYFMRRMAERPANLFFVVRNALLERRRTPNRNSTR